MPCCKADNFNWCKEEVVYEDTNGNFYCVFHAPKKEKRQSLESFNNLVFKKIIDEKATSGFCDLSGTVFEENISFTQFDRTHCLPRISFSGAVFNGNADFSSSVFVGDANFYGAVFNKVAGFSHVIFKGDADFSGVLFKEKANFSFTELRGDFYFISTSHTIFFITKLGVGRHA